MTTDLKILRVQIQTDSEDLIADLKAGLFKTGGFQKAWGKIQEKIRHYQILREEKKEQEKISQEAEMADEWQTEDEREAAGIHASH